MLLLCTLLLGSSVASASAGDSACSSAETTCADQTTLLQGRVKLASIETDDFDDAFLMESDDDEDSPSDNTPTSIPMSGNGSLTSANFGALDKDDSKVDLTTADGGHLNFKNVKGYGQAHSKKVFVGETRDGSATLDMIKKSTGIYGSIVNTATDTVTQIGHDSNGNTVVVAHNTNDYPEDAPPVESGQDDFLLFEQGLLQVDEHELADDGAVIDVMVVWTHHAECSNSRLPKGCTLTAATEKNMKGLIQLAILESNTAFDLSTVNTNFRLVHAYRDPSGYDEKAGFSDALNKVTGTTDGVMDGVHAERDKYRADVVALVISNPQYCGLGWLGPSKGRMFSVTAWNCATGYYSFVHEIMHNFGCHHDRGTKRACSSSNSYYGYRDPDGQFRSIMAYNCRTGQCDNIKKSGCTRIQRVSNPTTKWKGKPVGSAKANNAKRVNDVRKIVAQYYNSNTARPTTAQPTAAPTTQAPPTTTMAPATTVAPPAWTTAQPTAAPTTQAPPITTMPPTDLHKKLDAIEKKFDEILKILNQFAR